MTKKVFEWIVFLVLLPLFFLYLFVDYGEGCGLGIKINGAILCLNSSVEQLIANHIGSDVTYQIKFAYDYFTIGRIDEWVLNLWPPGLPFLHYVVILAIGYDAYPMKIMIVASFLYGLMCFTIYTHIFEKKWLLAAIFLSLFPFLYSSFRESLFYGLSVFSSDFFAFIALGCLVALLISNNLNGRLAIVASVCAAALAYLRSYYYLLESMYSITIAVLIVLLVLRSLKNNRLSSLLDCLKTPCLKITFKIFLATWLILVPWKILLFFKGAKYGWTSTDQVWAAQWRFDIPSFLAGLNTPCQINKALCEKLLPFQIADTWATPVLGAEFYKNLSLATFFRNPVDWYIDKSQVFYIFWFDGKQLGTLNGLEDFFQYAISLSILLLLISFCIIAVGKFAQYFFYNLHFFPKLVPEFLFSTFCFFNVVIFTFVHFESRYSVPIKWVTILFAVYMIKRRFHKIPV